jgi:hypothetical protein
MRLTLKRPPAGWVKARPRHHLGLGDDDTNNSQNERRARCDSQVGRQHQELKEHGHPSGWSAHATARPFNRSDIFS